MTHGHTRLTPTIRTDSNETDYVVRPLDLTPQHRVFRLRKLQGEEETYYVVETETGIECSCPDYFLRGSPCNHIHALQSYGMLT